MFKFFFVFSVVILCSSSVLAGSLDDLYLPDKNDKEERNALDVTEFDLWGKVRFHWGNLVSKDNVSILKQDVTCDGHVDYIASRTHRSVFDAPSFDLLVITRDGGVLASEKVSLEFDGSQEGLCGTGDLPVDVNVEPWQKEHFDAALGSQEGLCNVAINVDDSMCDVLRYFWHAGEGNTYNSRLLPFRN